MLRSSTSNDELQQELANVGLVADDIWAPTNSQHSAYRRSNRRLWTRSCKIAENYGKLGSATRSQRRVRDVIPESRLASYGDFEYEDEAELLRAVLHDDENDDEDDDDDDNKGKTTNGQSNDDDKHKEPWMLDEVEEYLARINDAAGKRRRSKREQVTKRDETLSDSHKSSNQTTSVREDRDKSTPLTMRELDDTSSSIIPPRFSITNVSEAQLEGRIFNESIRNLWRSPSPPSVILTNQQQQQFHRGLRNELQRELGLLQRPQSRASSDVQQTHSNFQTERLRMPSRSHYPYMQTLSNIQQQQQRAASLCVEVPEFFPTTNNSSNNSNKNSSWPTIEKPTTTQLQFTDAAYNHQDEMFAYKAHVPNNNTRKAVTLYQNTLVPMVPTPIVSAMVWPSQTWAQRLLPTPIPIHQMPAAATITIPQPPPQVATAASMCPTVIHRPIRLAEATSIVTKHSSSSSSTTSSHKHIPVYQRNVKVTQDYPQRRKSQGVDFNNLILLTKSAMKVRKTQTKPTRKSTFVESARKSDPITTTTRWLDKGYQVLQQKREREFVTVPTSLAKPQEDSNRVPSSSTTTTSSNEEEEDEDDDEFVTASSVSTANENLSTTMSTTTTTTRKRLYREVVLDRDDDATNNFERRYDELERQAMEQYRTSEECLALRYQELEQQALEQYRTAGSTESINESGHLDQRNDEEEKVDNVNDNDDGDNTRDCCSSGFGKCNNLDRVDVEKERKIEEQQPKQQQQPAATSRVRILRADVQRTSSEGSLRSRPIAVARRLPQSRSHKNNIDRAALHADNHAVRASSSLSSLKRRLMPLSPLMERSKSSGCPTTMITSSSNNVMRNLDPVKAAVQSLDKHVAAYYRSSNISQTGSGDAKVNGTAVWLSDFWS